MITFKEEKVDYELRGSNYGDLLLESRELTSKMIEKDFIQVHFGSLKNLDGSYTIHVSYRRMMFTGLDKYD